MDLAWINRYFQDFAGFGRLQPLSPVLGRTCSATKSEGGERVIRMGSRETDTKIVLRRLKTKFAERT